MSRKVSRKKKDRKEGAFSPFDIFEELKQNDLDPSIFDTIDDGDFEKAPNFLDFAISPKFLNTLILPKQVEIGVKLLNEYCPRCSNPNYINTLFDQTVGQIKDNIAFLEHGICPKCKVTRFELQASKELIFRNELVGVAGQRSGKTKLVGLLAAYINHRFLKIPNPIRTFNQTSGDVLMGTFSGLTLDQSFRNLWHSFKGFMDGSPWFQNYHRFLIKEGKRLGVELYHPLKTSILYAHKQIIWNCTGSQDRKMRGDTRIFAAIDELGWMVSDDTKDLQNMNADAIYTALTNSLTTMRTKYRQVHNATQFDLPPILMGNISSPSSAKDKIMRLEKSAKDNNRILATHLATWEANPDYTHESLREEFSHIEELVFMRDFGAEPPLAANPYLSEPRLIDKIAQGDAYDAFEIVPYHDKDFLGDTFKSAKLVVSKGDKATPRLLSLDLGVKKNALSLCMFSLTPDSKVQLDYVIALIPSKGIRINISDFFEKVTLMLVEHYKILYVFFDRWQSLDQVERLKNLGVNANIHSLTYKEMDSVRGAILAQSILIPKLSKPMAEYIAQYVEDAEITDAVANLGIQLLTVRDLGHRMSKPLLGDDDIFRAFCLGVNRLSDPVIKEKFINNNIVTKTKQSVAHLGIVRSRSSGSGNYSSSGGFEGENGRSLGSVKGRKRS